MRLDQAGEGIYELSRVIKSQNKSKIRRTKDLQNNQKTMNKMPIASAYLPIINLNVNGLKSLIKRYNGWMDKKTRRSHMWPTRNSCEL